MNKFYLTSAIPYVNAKPHIGHALEFIQADVVNRYRKLLGDDVLYLCGSDENAIKNVQAAEKENVPVQEFIDENAKNFERLFKNLNIKLDIFQKGSSPEHHRSSQMLWELCAKNDDIYKKTYTGLYCIGCEQFYTKKELNENGECFEHPGKKLEEIEEENYFFKLSRYQSQILKLLESGEYEVVPEFRKNEVLSFVKRRLEDFSISRSNKRARDWGVPVPGDPTQRIYVWFDALNIYQSGIGFGTDEKEYKKWWPADLHMIGKGIIRFHAIYWPAILISAGLKLPKKLFVHEYFTVNGQKMSKTLGNVIDPDDLIKKYGADALRYYCLAKFSAFQDGDFSEEKFAVTYNSDLANGLGNLVARVAKLCEKHEVEVEEQALELDENIVRHINSFNFNDALNYLWAQTSKLDQKINQEKPWELEGEKAKEILTTLAYSIREIAYNLQPFMPDTAEKIITQYTKKVTSSSPLFPRLN